MYQQSLPNGWEGQHPHHVRPPYDTKAQLRIHGYAQGRDIKTFGGTHKPFVIVPKPKDAAPSKLPPAKSKATTRPQGILKEFFTSTSIPGFSHLGRNQNVFGKTYWLLMFLGSLGLAVNQSWGLMNEYFKYNTYQQSVLRLNTSVMLPAITFCSKNPVRWQKAKSMNHSIVKMVDFTSELAWGFSSKKDMLTKRYLWEMNLLGLIRNYWIEDSLEELDPIMLDINSTLATCRLNLHVKCDARDVIRFYHPYYGYCQTYNSGIGRPMIFTEPGKDVMLVIFLDRTEEFEFLARTVGAVLFLHEPGTAPILSSPTVQNMYPGEWMKIGITLSKVQRLPEPYPSKCIKSDDPGYRPYTVYYTEQTPYLYSYEACQTTCLQNRTVKVAECAIQKIPTLKNVDRDLCSVKNNDIYNSDKMNLQNCDCPPTCSETFYHTKVTFERGLIEYSYWQDAVRGQLEEVLKLINDSSPSAEVTMKQFADNIAAVQLYFETAIYDETEELPKYSVADFWGAVGGNIGFWTGISVLALMELVELFFTPFGRLLLRVYAKSRPRTKFNGRNRQQHFAGNPTAASNPFNAAQWQR